MRISGVEAITALVMGAILCCPIPAWATRGEGDIGIMIAVFVFSLPIDFALLGLIVYSIVRLKSKEPKKGQGRIVLALSVAVMATSAILPPVAMHRAEWYFRMVQTMLFVFAPIFALSTISAALALRVKKRAKTAPNV